MGIRVPQYTHPHNHLHNCPNIRVNRHSHSPPSASRHNLELDARIQTPRHRFQLPYPSSHSTLLPSAVILPQKLLSIMPFLNFDFASGLKSTVNRARTMPEVKNGAANTRAQNIQNTSFDGSNHFTRRSILSANFSDSHCSFHRQW